MNKKIFAKFFRSVVFVFIVALLFGCNSDSSSGDFLLLADSSDSKEYDFNNDGTIDRVEYYTYDSDGNQVQKEYDYNNDGAIDTVEYYTYDNDDNLVKFEWDFGNDGTVDWRSSGSDSATQVGPAITEEELRTASERIVAGDQEYELETCLWRDFMPISPPNGWPLIARVSVVEQNGNPIASDLKLEYLWVIKGSKIWATIFSDEALLPSPQNELDGIARNGPKWEPEIQVDVVVGLRRGDGSLELLRAADQWIYMTQ